MNFAAEDTRPEPICTDQDTFERGVALDELDIRVRSRAFRGGRLTAVMSGVTVDLREATLGPDGATITMQSALSDIEILVPGDWDVVCDVAAVFAGVDGRRFPPSSAEPCPRLRLTGMVVAGGVCIR